MKVFIDTNILIDYICCREPFFVPAKSIFASCYAGKIDVVVSGLSIANLLYICRKHDTSIVKASVLGLSRYIEVVDLPSKVVLKGLSSEWKDYEDFLQHETAIVNGCDCILTRNLADFANSSLPVYDAPAFLTLYLS